MQKNLYTKKLAITTTASIVTFNAKTPPNVCLNSLCVLSNGIPPSSVPTGQMYLQNAGSPIPKKFVTIIGSNNTKTTKIMYFMRVIHLGSFTFFTGNLFKSSCSNPNGHMYPQINRPNMTPIASKKPTT